MALSRGGHLWLRNSSRYEEVGPPSFSPGPMYKPWALPSARAAGQDARWSWDKAVGLENKETLPTSTAFGHGSSCKQHQWEGAGGSTARQRVAMGRLRLAKDGRDQGAHPGCGVTVLPEAEEGLHRIAPSGAAAG